jgi:hypothetical protein
MARNNCIHECASGKLFATGLISGASHFLARPARVQVQDIGNTSGSRHG